MVAHAAAQTHASHHQGGADFSRRPLERGGLVGAHRTRQRRENENSGLACCIFVEERVVRSFWIHGAVADDGVVRPAACTLGHMRRTLLTHAAYLMA